jgi:hypothetical protein
MGVEMTVGITIVIGIGTVGATGIGIATVTVTAIGNADRQQNALAQFNEHANWNGVGNRNC